MGPPETVPVSRYTKIGQCSAHQAGSVTANAHCDGIQDRSQDFCRNADLWGVMPGGSTMLEVFVRY